MTSTIKTYPVPEPEFMNWRSKAGRMEMIFLCSLLIAASALMFFNLGNRYMWQDEAQTPLIAQTVVDRGLPYGTDGRNFFSQDSGMEYGKNHIWKWHPWLTFYIAAPLIKIFGANNTTARLPFAILGLMTVMLSYFFVRELFGSKRKAMLASSMLALYVPFLILAKQSRYYSPEMFFCMLSLYSYVLYTRGGKWQMVGLLLSLTALFHTLYIYFFIVSFAVIIHAALFERKYLASTAGICAYAFVINLPAFFWLYNINFVGAHPNAMKLWQIAESFRAYFTQILKGLFSPFLLLLIPVYITAKYALKRELGTEGNEYISAVSLLLIFAAMAVIIMAVLAPTPFYRNLSGIVPVFAILTALMIAPAFHIKTVAGIAAVLAVLVFIRLPDYLYEITHDYKGPVKCMVDFFAKNGKSGGTIAITYGDMPLKFYTKMKVVGALEGSGYDMAKHADWIIIRRHVMEDRDAKMADYIRKNLKASDYIMITLDCPDMYDENNDSPLAHNFTPDEKEGKLVIYKRKTVAEKH
jgi:4-amino-4-deoxy-L-arabinose transferase-like glycosyltransferase